MTERRFVIREVLSAETNSGQGTITESEFHRRIDLAFRAAFCTLDEKFDYDKAVEILVNGESPQAEVDRLSAELSKNHAKLHGEGEIGKAYPDHGGNLWETDNSPIQPSPTPTREEWEMWANNLAWAITDNTTFHSQEYQRKYIEDRILAMPIVPRGK